MFSTVTPTPSVPVRATTCGCSTSVMFGARCSRFAACAPPSPVAIIVTRSRSSIASSITVPTITIASSAVNSLIVFITSWYSRIRRPDDAVMLTSTPRAPARLTSSSSGLLTAASRRLPRAIGAVRHRRAHHRHADLAHHGAHVGEVDVDEPGIVDDLGDAGHRAVQHVVRRRVGVEHRDVVAQHLHQLVVGDDDQRVDALRELLDARLRDLLPLAPSNLNGRVTTATVRMSMLFAMSAMTGAAPVPVPPPMPGGDEQHVRALDHLGDAVAILHRRVAADLRLARPRRGPRVSVAAELQLRRARSSASAPARRCSRR